MEETENEAMKIQLQIAVIAPAVARNAAEVKADLRQLILDSLQAALQRHPAFKVRIAVKKSADKSEPLLTKAEVAQYTNMTTRNVNRCVKEKKLPEPIRIAAPHCRNGSPRWFPEDIRTLAVKWQS